jgi:hypothetical protein
MRKRALRAFGVLLISGSVAQMSASSAGSVHKEQVKASQQFRNSNNSLNGGRGTFCSQEAGNPYDKLTDYGSWSAWRQLGAWDSRHDC